ncbi:PAS domain S-box protein [Psychrobacillus mangrovi]|uniref:PAS domain S-box protein n=1 Tax=Psychrobacillus mangrovi TaxID=3117745 RepID=UPI0039B77587
MNVNRAFTELVGYELNEILGRSATILYPRNLLLNSTSNNYKALTRDRISQIMIQPKNKRRKFNLCICFL